MDDASIDRTGRMDASDASTAITSSPESANIIGENVWPPKWFATNVRQVCDRVVGRSLIARDGGFGNGDSELQQFAVDPRRSPETILGRHTPDEISTGWIDTWSARRSPQVTAPGSASAFAMPTIDRGWLDQHQRFSPPGPQPPQEEPQPPKEEQKQTTRRAEALIRTSENAELVTQGKRLRAGDLDASPEPIRRQRSS